MKEVPIPRGAILRLVTRVSGLTGETHSMLIPLTDAQWIEIQPYIDDNKPGRLIQEICPELPADLREFILTGATPQEWYEHFGREEEV